MIIAGLDLSLASTGVARVAATGPDPTYTLVRVRSDPGRNDLNSRAARVTRMREGILVAAGLTMGDPPPDLAVVEAPTYGTGAEAGTWERAWLWGAVVSELHDAGVPTMLVTPHTIRKYITGSAATSGARKVSKDMVLAGVIRRFPKARVDGNDVADALAAAAIAFRLLGHPIDHDLTADMLEALTVCRLPGDTTAVPKTRTTKRRVKPAPARLTPAEAALIVPDTKQETLL
jgi:Holliday junction resolvasome RuvABC endonuclease subunit